MMFYALLFLSVCHLATGMLNVTESGHGKVLSVFNVVRFPNELCASGTSKNGTCYTTSECKSNGGTSSGTCANGYGVCCIFTLGCGGSSSENSTYFESPANIGAGQCSATICKINSDICQLRIDFNTFVINGPSTVTASSQKILAGNALPATGVAASSATRCLTDYFSVTGSENNPSIICGTNSGQHMFVDAGSCSKLNFHLGTNALGLVKIDTRSWSLKISQISCLDPNLPPAGCTQYYYGTTTGKVQSYNYGATTPTHLANQDQKICIRRERGLCRMCYYAVTATDFKISGVDAMKGGAIKSASQCCGYGTNGMKITWGYDCLIVPGAAKQADAGTRLQNSVFCGNNFATASMKKSNTAARATHTVCTKQSPFMIEFLTDNWEFAAETGNKGFQLGYFEDAVGCA